MKTLVYQIFWKSLAMDTHEKDIVDRGMDQFDTDHLLALIQRRVTRDGLDPECFSVVRTERRYNQKKDSYGKPRPTARYNHLLKEIAL